MPTRPLTDEQLRDAVALRAKCPSICEAARQAGYSENAFRNRLAKAADRGFTSEPVVAGYAEAGEQFELPPGHRIDRLSVLVDEDGKTKSQWIKTRASSQDPVSTVDAIRSAIADIAERAPPIDPPEDSDEDLATVYLCADFHMGLLSYHRETGHNWDLKIAQETIGTALTRLVSASPAAHQGVVLGLGDLLHADNYDNETSHSKNKLDVDGRYPRVLQAATRIMISVVDLALRKHETVLVRVLPGNHDNQSAIAVSLALAMYYSDNTRVTVDDDPGYFWWWSWGSTFLGATHGDQAKMKDLPLIMATRNPEAWGRSQFRHLYTGHVHHASAIEISGVTVESFQAPTAPDSWHARMGFGANRSLTSITLHREHGEIARNKVNIVQPRLAA